MAGSGLAGYGEHLELTNRLHCCRVSCRRLAIRYVGALLAGAEYSSVGQACGAYGQKVDCRENLG